MRHTTTLFTFLVIISTSAFSQADSTTFISKVWKMAPESVQITAKSRLEKMKKDNPAMAGQVTVEMIAGMMSQSTFEFRADGKYITETPQGTFEGTWKLSADKTALITYVEPSGETTRKIQRINEKLLTLKSSDNTLTSFYPAK